MLINARTATSSRTLRIRKTHEYGRLAAGLNWTLGYHHVRTLDKYDKILKKQFIYFLWSFLFLYFLLDDSIGFHENYGNYLAELFEFQSMFNLRPADLGEFLVSLCIGAIFLMAFLFSYYKADLIGKKITRTISILIVMLVFFGVFIDLLHIAVAYQNNRWTIVEDSGEMFVMSLIVGYTFYLNSRFFKN